jgi:pimeloyl-ACP methyl ester carboxylesterase
MTKVFVHGNPETDAIWGPLVEALASRGVTDVLLLSPPGFGAATPAGWDATPASYVGWLAGELERIGGDIDLVGHDWGAGHVYGLLATRPELIRSWAADCAGLLHPDYVWHDLAQVWQQPGAGEQWVEDFASTSVDDRTAFFASVGISQAVARSMAEAGGAEMGRCVLALYRGAAQPAMTELGAQLTRTPCPPGLVIDPTDDPYVSSDLAPTVADRLGARRLELPGQGHWWMLHDPAPAADGLVAFWDGL